MQPTLSTPQTLLLVEDEALIAFTTTQILKSWGYLVKTALTGEEALLQVRAFPEIELVLMDINLGRGIDGTEAARIILQERDIPVVFLSGHTEPDVVEKTEKITSYGYVVKGSSDTVLLASIKMAFKLHAANSQLKERELRLERSEKRFRALVENSRDAFGLLDANGLILYEGPSVPRLTGYPVEERLGKSGVELIHPEDQPMVISTYARVAAQPGRTETLQFRSTRKNGSIWWVEAAATNLLHEPDVQAIVVNYRDITLRKQAEAALMESEARYRLLLHSGNDAIFVHGIDEQGLTNHFIEVNQKCCEMLGYEPEELLALSPLDISVPAENFFMRNLAEELLRQERAVFEMRLRRKDGSLIDTELSSHLIETGHAREVLSIARDVTHRKKAELALRESEEQFRLVWAESPIAKELYDANGYLIDANRECLALFGVASLEDVRGFQLFEDPNITSEVKERLLSGQLVNYEAPFDFDKIHENRLYPTEKSGQIQISVQVTPLHANGTTAGYLVQVQDVTERKQAEAALEQALSEKSMLLSDLQHRIKNSLSLIASLIILGQNNATGSEAKVAMEELYSRVKALSGLYEVLYGSKDANEIRLDQYLRQIAESLAASYLHKEKGIELSIQCEQLLVDARYATPFGLILNELLTNALKYAFPAGQAGSIRVVLRRVGDDRAELVVSNDGCMIPPDFDLQNSSGLGLKIVQMLVGQLQGAITCQSNGETTFLVQVPLENILRTQDS